MKRHLLTLALSFLAVLSSTATGASAPPPTPSTPPLRKIEVAALLAAGAPAQEVAGIVERNGIAFQPTKDFLKLARQIEASGALGWTALSTALASAKVESPIPQPSANQAQILVCLSKGAELLQNRHPATAGIQAAAGQFRRALNLDPKNSVLHFPVVAALFAEGKYKLALPEAQAFLAGAPNLAIAHMAVAEALAGSGDETGAMKELRLGVQVDPDSIFARVQLAQALFQTNDAQDAIQTIRDGIALQPNNPTLHDSLGTALYEAGDVNGAIAEFKRSLALGSKDPETRIDLSDALLRTGDRKGAIAATRDAIQLDPTAYRYHYRLAEELIDGGKLPEAKTELQEVIRLKPGFALAHSELGYVLRRQNDLAGAIAEYRQAIRLNPNLAVAHYNLGTALYKDHQHQAAYQQVLLAHELAPANEAITEGFNRLPAKYKAMATQPPDMPRPAQAAMGEPPKAGFLYFADSQSNSLIPLEAEEPVIEAKSGLFGTGVSITVVGDRSPVRLKPGATPQFLFRSSLQLNIKLFRFATKKGSRTLSTRKKWEPSTDPSKPGELAILSNPYGKSSTEITVPYTLPPGEYGFLVSARNGNSAIFCFGVARR